MFLEGILVVDFSFKRNPKVFDQVGSGDCYNHYKTLTIALTIILLPFLMYDLGHCHVGM
jgi:hypothetical protein